MAKSCNVVFQITNVGGSKIGNILREGVSACGCRLAWHVQRCRKASKTLESDNLRGSWRGDGRGRCTAVARVFENGANKKP